MRIRKFVTGICIITLSLCLCPRSFAQAPCYEDVPNILECETQAVAEDIIAEINRNPGRDPDVAVMNQLNPSFARLMFFAVADALTDIKEIGARCSFRLYQHLGETARTDKQIEPSAKASGTTTLTEKPGFAQLLGIAISRGAIKQEVDGTSLTLSTSPYALIVLANQKDTAALYQSSGLFNRIGMSATFNISDEENVLANATRKELEEWTVRARLTGDKSVRGAAFRKFWDTHIAAVVGRPASLTNEGEGLLSANEKLDKLRRRLAETGAPDSIPDQIKAYLNNATGATDAQKISEIKRIILCTLKKSVTDPIKANLVVIPEDIQTRIVGALVPQLAATPLEVEEARVELEKFLKELNNKPEATLAYTNHRTVMGSDYSEVKLIYRVKASWINVNFNAGASFYHHPDEMMNQEKVRDYGVSLSFEGESSNPLSREVDLSKITYTFAGSYERIKENEGLPMKRADIANVQFRVEIPITLGLSIPIAYTFATATETSMKKENKFNVGLNLDVDKLLEIRRADK